MILGLYGGGLRCSVWPAPLLLLIGLAAAGCGPRVRTDRHVIVISMDGLSPRHYLEAERRGYTLPTLHELIQHGMASQGVRSVYPSVTYPAHASMMTGVPPARHGIYANSFYLNGKRQPHISGRDYRAPPLWRELHRRGVRIGSVFWPVTADEPIDWLLPEAWWDDDKGNDALRLQKEAAISTPGLLDSLRRFIGEPLNHYFESDTVKTDAALYILQRYRPNLLLLHYSHLDYIQHLHGAFAPETIATLQMQDTQIGRIVEAVRRLGLADRTTFLVVSDHGHAAFDSLLHPGVLLAREGLVALDSAGNLIDWRATVLPTGGSCSILLHGNSDAALARQVLGLFVPPPPVLARGLAAVFQRPQIDSLGANAGALLMLEARPGYAFGGAFRGEPVTAAGEYRSTHGYLPEREAMLAGFIASGHLPPNFRIADIKRITDIHDLLRALFFE